MTVRDSLACSRCPLLQRVSPHADGRPKFHPKVIVTVRTASLATSVPLKTSAWKFSLRRHIYCRSDQNQRGLKFPTVMTIHRGVFVPVVTPSWEGSDLRLLESAQIVVLIAATEAYRTASASVSCVIAGALSITSEVRMTCVRYRLRARDVVHHGERTFSYGESYPSLLLRLDESWSSEERGQVSMIW